MNTNPKRNANDVRFKILFPARFSSRDDAEKSEQVIKKSSNHKATNTDIDA
jgi:hypothetical protein